MLTYTWKGALVLQVIPCTQHLKTRFTGIPIYIKIRECLYSLKHVLRLTSHMTRVGLKVDVCLRSDIYSSIPNRLNASIVYYYRYVCE